MLAYIRFTPKEWEIIAHRLGVADAIADALTDHCEGDEPEVPNPPEEVEAAAREMLADGPGLLIGTRLQLAVLLDACDGSTFFGNFEPEDVRKWSRVARAIEQKIFDHLGERVSIPRE